VRRHNNYVVVELCSLRRSVRACHEHLATMSPSQEIYSIDECFLDFADSRFDKHGQHIRQTSNSGWSACLRRYRSEQDAGEIATSLRRNAAIQWSFDIGQIPADEQTAIMQSILVDEIWGIGRNLSDRLNSIGIRKSGSARCRSGSNARTV